MWTNNWSGCVSLVCHLRISSKLRLVIYLWRARLGKDFYLRSWRTCCLPERGLNLFRWIITTNWPELEWIVSSWVHSFSAMVPWNFILLLNLINFWTSYSQVTSRCARKSTRCDFSLSLSLHLSTGPKQSWRRKLTLSRSRCWMAVSWPSKSVQTLSMDSQGLRWASCPA